MNRHAPPAFLRLLPILGALVTVAACAPAVPERPDQVDVDAERSALAEREGAFLVAMAALDADGVAAFFTDDAELHIANMPRVRGREAIRTFYGNVFRFMAESAPTAETTRMSASADLAVSTGSVRNAFDGPDGRVEYEGKYFLAWERRDGAWWVVVYGVSGDAADPGR